MSVEMSNREYGNLLTAKMLAICPPNLVADVQEKLLQQHSVSDLNSHMKKLGVTDKFKFVTTPVTIEKESISNNKSILPKPGR